MPNTPANDAPYAIGAIEDAATADYPGLTNANDTSGLGDVSLIPVVVNADGSFTAAFAVTAPSYDRTINTTALGDGTASFFTGGGVVRDYNFFNVTPASGGTVTFTLQGRNAAGAPVSIALTPGPNGHIAITEAILANFAPGSAQQLSVSGLAPSSQIFGNLTVDVAAFYDGAAPATIGQALALTPTVPGNGTVVMITPPGLAESFTLQNAAAWTTPSSSYNLIFFTQQPLDLSGIASGVVQANVLTPAAYSTVVTVAAVGGVIEVPPVLLQQLESRPGSVLLQVQGAVVGSTPQAQVTLQPPVTTITEGLYVQNFDADGNPTGDAVRIDEAANALLQDQDDMHFVMSRSADGELVIAWLGNDDADGEVDAVYVRKLDSAGNPTSETTALTGLSAEALDSITNDEGEAGIAALADGGFAVAYTVSADEVSYSQSFFGNGPNNGNAGIVFVLSRGQLETISIDTSTPVGAGIASSPKAGSVSGLDASGATIQVPVTITNGFFEMTDDIRSAFADGARLTLTITGITANPSAPPSNTPGFFFVPATVTARDIYSFDETSPVNQINRTANVSATPNPSTATDAFVFGSINPTVAFQINALTAAAAETPDYVLYITSTHPINTSGLNLYTGVAAQPYHQNIANSVNQATKLYQNSIVVTPVNGRIDVPQALIDQFPNGGYVTTLAIRGLAAGSQYNIDTIERLPATITQPGVFVQLFGADGAAEGPAQQIDDADASLADAAPFASDDGSLGVTALAGGGFRVSWIAQSNDGSGVDRIINREFDADGNAVGTAIDVNGLDIPGVLDAALAGGDVGVPGDLQMVELGDGGFAALVQVTANETFATISSFGVAPGGGNTGSISFSALQGQLNSVQIDISNPVGAALASQPRAGFVGGKGLDGNALQVPVTVVNGRFEMTEEIRAQFGPSEELFLTVTGVTNPASPNSFSFVFVPALITSRDVFTYDASSPVLTLNSTVTATNNPTLPNNADGFFGSNIGVTAAFQINALTPAASETPDYVLYVTSEQPIDVTGLSIYSGANTSPIYSSVPNNTLGPNGLFATTLSVTPIAGRIDVPQALLDQFPKGGFNVALQIRGLQGGSPLNVDTIVRQPSKILETGLFVQLFDSAGTPTGELIRVDNPSTSALGDDENVPASIQSDGSGGFKVVWLSDANGDYDSDALNIRNFDTNGNVVGETLSVEAIPDRIYDEGEAVTLYTSGLFADPDPGDVLTFSATGLPGGLSIDPATGVIGGAAGVSGLFAVTVFATDSGGLSASTNFEIFIIDDGEIDVNLAPTAVSLANTVTETPESGGPVKVADIIVADDGLGTNLIELTGADAASFSIVGNALFFNGDGDFETQTAYDVTVSVRDPALPDPAVTQDFHLTLTDVAENMAPTAVNLVNTLAETPENGSLVKVADIVVTDDGLGANVIELVGPDAGAFSIFGTSLFFNGSANFEAKALYAVTVTVRDVFLADAPVSADLLLSITDVLENQPPTALNLSNVVTSVPEFSGPVQVATLEVVDDGLGGNYFYLEGPDTGSFFISGNALFFTGGNFDVQSNYNIVINARDDSFLGDPVSQPFQLTVTDVDFNTAPTAVTLPVGGAQVLENSGLVKLTDIFVQDDGLGQVVLELTGPNAGYFQIIGSELYFNGGDYENFPVSPDFGIPLVDVTVSARDPNLPDAPVTANFQVLLSDVAEDQTINGTNAGDVINTRDTTPERLASIDNFTVFAGGGNDVIQTGIGNDVIYGDTGDDAIYTNYGDDKAYGGSGNDLIVDHGGNNELFGDAGDDTITVYAFAGESTNLIDGGGGNDTLTGSFHSDAILGGSGDDLIAGGEGGDSLNGGTGNDEIDGGDGDDEMIGGLGDDTFTGGAGNDSITAETGNDLVFAGGGDDAVDGGTGDDFIAGELGRDSLLGGVGNDHLDGGEDDDAIDGGIGNDDIFGGSGIDQILGGTGDDTIAGDDGADVIDAGAGNDAVNGGAEADTIDGGTGNDALNGAGGADTLRGGSGDDELIGAAGGDTLDGAAGNDTANGGAGADTIIGGLGIDLLTGGSGGDSFVFSNKADSRLGALADHITDFSLAQGDRIDLSLIDANTKLADDQAFTWIGSGAFTKSAGQLRYEVIGSNAHLTGDINGDGKADFEIVLDGVTSLPGTSDFLIL